MNDKNINVLITGIGRRIELLQAFRNAALKLDIDLKIYGADISETAPALIYCDYVRKTCRMNNPGYINQLLNICVKDHIDLIVPTIDTDLLILSENTESFDRIGTKVLISSKEKIIICRDKNYTYDFFISCGLKSPLTFNDYKKFTGGYPCFIKPKDGSSSINAYRVDNYAMLKEYADLIKDYVIQQYISGTEYTVDIFCDFDGNPISIVPRERMSVRSGEVLKTKICMDSVIIEECKKIIKHFKPCGPLTVQLIREKSTGKDYYIEINPRFGGGAPLSMKAGARSIEDLLNIVCKKEVSYRTNISDNIIFSRFDQSVCIGTYNREMVKGIIFDLDDTLYSEKEYIKSGFKRIAEFLDTTDGQDKMWEYFIRSEKPIDSYLKEIGRESDKNKCLEIYRSHKPNIHLYNGAAEMLYRLKKQGKKIGIITDGRAASQKNKLLVLGLYDIVDDIIITDELGGIQFRKPNDIAFRMMQCKWKLSFENIIYVGDNINKDFQAPRQLGMQCLYFENSDGLYYMNGTEMSTNSVKSIQEMDEKL